MSHRSNFTLRKRIDYTLTHTNSLYNCINHQIPANPEGAAYLAKVAAMLQYGSIKINSWPGEIGSIGPNGPAEAEIVERKNTTKNPET